MNWKQDEIQGQPASQRASPEAFNRGKHDNNISVESLVIHQAPKAYSEEKIQNLPLKSKRIENRSPDLNLNCLGISRASVQTKLIPGNTIFGWNIIHQVQLFPKSPRGRLIRVSTTAHFKDQTLLIFNKSDNNALNVATYFNCINRLQSIGKFTFCLATGEWKFESHSYTMLSDIKPVEEMLVEAAEDALTFHLPKILLIFHQIEYDKFVELSTNSTSDAVRQIHPWIQDTVRKIHELTAKVEESVTKPSIDGPITEIRPALQDASLPTEPERFIVSEVLILEKEKEFKNIETIERVGQLSIMLVKAKFRYKDVVSDKTIHLLEVSSNDCKYLENTMSLGEYFLSLKKEKCYYRNILPLYLEYNLAGALVKIDQKKRFFHMFNKHGNLKMFLKSSPPRNCRFFLSILLQLVRTQLYYFEAHSIIHMDPSLQLIYIMRTMQIQLGYLGKCFILPEKFREVNYRYDYAEYTKNFVLPSCYAYVAPEVFQRKPEHVTEKCAVFYIANHIENLFFQRDRGFSKLQEDDVMLRSQEQGKFILNYLPKDITEAAPKVITQPLCNFVRLCLNPQYQKRPTLRQLEEILSDCLQAFDLLYQ